MVDFSARRASSGTGRGLAAIRRELGNLRSSIRRIELELNELENADDRTGGVQRERPERYLRVLVEVYERGGQHGVDADGLAMIGQRHGYDRRGLGGFFTGARAPLRRIDDRTRLSHYGEQLMHSYLADPEARR